MKCIKLLSVLLACLVINVNSTAAVSAEKPTAKGVFEKIKNAKAFNEAELKTDWQTLSLAQKSDFIRMAINDARSGNTVQGGATIGEYILAVLIPPVAVGLHTNWDTKPTLINLVLTCLFWLPGVVHAIIVLEG